MKSEALEKLCDKIESFRDKIADDDSDKEESIGHNYIVKKPEHVKTTHKKNKSIIKYDISQTDFEESSPHKEKGSTKHSFKNSEQDSSDGELTIEQKRAMMKRQNSLLKRRTTLKRVDTII